MKPAIACVFAPVIVMAELPAVNVPPLLMTRSPPRVNAKLPVANVVPLLMVSTPLLVSAEPKVAVPAPEKVTLLKVADPVMDGAVLLKITVLEAPVNIPLFDQLPETVRVLAPETVRVAPLLIVKLLQVAAALIIGA